MGNETIVKLLLATGEVDVNAKSWNNWTPLSGAIEKGHQNTVELLLKAGAKTDIEYIVIRSAPSWVHAFVKSIANLDVVWML